MPSLTKKDLEARPKRFAWLLKIVLFFAKVLKPITRIGVINRQLRKSFGAQIGAISRFEQRGEHDKAADIAIELLRKYRHRSPGQRILNGADFWWFFMSLATRSLEQSGDPVRWKEAIEMAESGPGPLEGYEVARSFLSIARWKYRQRDFDATVEYATIASKADVTWAEPDFFTGWFCLALGRGDAMAHLSLAVDKDPEIMARIEKDPTCRRHPRIIEGLGNMSRKDPNSRPEGPQATG